MNLGNLGEIFVYVAFATALFACLHNFFAVNIPKIGDSFMGRMGKWVFTAHGLCIGAAIVCLGMLAFSYQYNYYYIWVHVGQELPLPNLIASLWSGKEGALLVWCMWNALIGVVLLRKASPSSRFVVGLIAGFNFLLLSNLLGIDLGIWRSGNSPFALLQEVFAGQEVFRQYPDFVPQDGKGLHPWMKSLWKCFQRPSLLLGYAASVVPFGYALYGLMFQNFSSWIPASSKWIKLVVFSWGISLFANMIWTYGEIATSDFWRWEFEESMLLGGFLLALAMLHVMLLYQRNKQSVRLNFGLCIALFLYVCFVPPSLLANTLVEGNSSNVAILQLQGILKAFGIVCSLLAVALLLKHWKSLPVGREKDFEQLNHLALMMQSGAMLLVLASALICFLVSLPVVNSFLGTNWATPVDLSFFLYSWIVWIAILLSLFAAAGQFLWWHVRKGNSMIRAMMRPLLISFALGLGILGIMMCLEMDFVFDSRIRTMMSEAFGRGPFGWIQAIQHSMLWLADELLLVVVLFLIVSCVDVSRNKEIRAEKLNKWGLFMYAGTGLMVLGLLFSSGFEQVLSQNSFTNEFKGLPIANRTDHISLKRFQSKTIDRYLLSFDGSMMEASALGPMANPEGAKATYALDFEANVDRRSAFRLYPEIELNGDWQNLLSRPDRQRFLTHDIRAHIAGVPARIQKEPLEFQTGLGLGDTKTLWDLELTLMRINDLQHVPRYKHYKAAFAAQLRLVIFPDTFFLSPELVVNEDGASSVIAASLEYPEVVVVFQGFDSESQQFQFQLRYAKEDLEEVIVIKVVKKPMVILLWIGMFMLLIGSLAILTSNFFFE